MANLSVNNLNKQSPAWVLAALAAITFICQGLPPILGGYDIISPKTKEVVSLICDVINLIAAAIAPMVGGTKQDA